MNDKNKISVWGLSVISIGIFYFSRDMSFITLAFLLIVTVLFLILDKRMRRHSFHWIDYLLAIIISCVLVQSSLITFTSVSMSYSINRLIPWSVRSLILWLVNFNSSLLLISNLKRLIKFEKINRSIQIKKVKNLPRFFCLLLLLCWSPYLLALYPGCVLPDTLSSINQALGNLPLSNHHPVFFTLFLKIFLTSFSFLGINQALFIYTLVQTSIFAGSLTYFLRWLAKYGLAGRTQWLAFFYFALAPVFPIYALNIQKDTLFSVFLFLFTLKLIDVFIAPEMKRSEQVGFVTTAVLTSFYRGNGLYVVVACMLVVLVYLVKQKRGQLAAKIFIPYFVLTFLVIHPLIGKIAQPTETAESFGIPLQQVSRTVALQGKIDPSSKRYLNELLSLKEYQNYAPMLVDNIKWNSKFNNHLLQQQPKRFLAVWLRLLKPNLKVYCEAYLLNTYGFWAPFEKNNYGFLDTRVNQNNLGITQLDLFQRFTGSSLMQKVIAKRNFFGSGTLFWLLILSAYLAIWQKKKILLIGYLPSLLTWLSIMVATPVAFSLRYVLILALSLPLFLSLPFFKFSK